MNLLAIIPARGGSKGIPRKNLRTLNKQPLISYSIKTALASKHNLDVYVSSDDDEILAISKKFGARTITRSPNLADESTPLDPVILDACQQVQRHLNKSYDYVITLQPTSPLLTTNSLDKAIDHILTHPELETLISAKEEAHLSWKRDHNQFVPNYSERKNRQFLEPIYYETGSFVICQTNTLTQNRSRFGKKVDIFLLKDSETIDIDTYEHWSICEFLLKRKTILFVVTGYNEVGLGHVSRCLSIANNIWNHRILFLADKKSDLGLKKITQSNFEAHIQTSNELLTDIIRLKPDIIVNDILDTSENYVRELKKRGMTVINFEDLGTGTSYADAVFNALYPEKQGIDNHYFGHPYFIPRDEFIYSDYKEVGKVVKKVLITMGGTDPANLTQKVAKSIYSYCQQNQIELQIILGLGYSQQASLQEFGSVPIIRDVKNMSDHMLDADIIFTSAGRTVYEIACLGTPTIVLGQNAREMTHLFADSTNGFIHLGLGEKVPETFIQKEFIAYCQDFEGRLENSKRMLKHNIRNGRDRVMSILNDLLESSHETQRSFQSKRS